MALPFFPIDIRQRRFKLRSSLESMTQYEIRKHSSLPQENLMELFDILGPFLNHQTKRSRAVAAETQLLGALSFFRSGSFQYVGGTVAGISQSTISRTIDKVSTSIVTRLVPHSILFPTDLGRLNETKKKFFELANFPNIIGVVDGTHVCIKPPHKDENSFVNRKGKHSINVQIVCDPDYLVTDTVVKWPGATHDSFIWRNSGIRDRFQQGEFGESWLLGDSGYPAEPNLLTPIGDPSNEPERRYNKSFKTSRCIVERTIGVWKSRFRSMHGTGGALCYTPEKCCNLILSTLYLHNYCVRRRIPLTTEDEFFLLSLELDAMTNSVGILDQGSGVVTRNNLILNYFT